LGAAPATVGAAAAAAALSAAAPPQHYPRNAKITIAMFLANGLEQTVCRQGSAKQRALRAAVCFVKFLFGFGCFVVFLNVGTIRTTQRIHIKSEM
jgi:hypothetical protein